MGGVLQVALVDEDFFWRLGIIIFADDANSRLTAELYDGRSKQKQNESSSSTTSVADCSQSFVWRRRVARFDGLQLHSRLQAAATRRRRQARAQFAVNDDVEHTIELNVSDARLSLRVDRQIAQLLPLSSNETRRSTAVDSPLVYVGGVPQSLAYAALASARVQTARGLNGERAARWGQQPPSWSPFQAAC